MHYTDLNIFVAKHKDIVGSAYLHRLIISNYGSIIRADRNVLDHLAPATVSEFFCSKLCNIVYLAATKPFHKNEVFCDSCK